MKASRGFSRAASYLLGSDDEMPEPHPAGPAHLCGSKSLHPPPPKQLQPSAVSVQMAKSIEKAIAADQRQCIHTNMQSADPCLLSCVNLLHHRPRLYHKIGMCRFPYRRFNYLGPDSR